MTDIQKFAETLSRTKLRVFSQGDILALKCVSDQPDINASTMIMCIMKAQDKMISLSQLSPVLKVLVSNGLLTTKETASEATGRPMATYRLTRKGTAVLEAAETMLENIGRKT